eukprot:11836395-Alexandrium_andersonii.AAC.1
MCRTQVTGPSSSCGGRRRRKAVPRRVRAPAYPLVRGRRYLGRYLVEAGACERLGRARGGGSH